MKTKLIFSTLFLVFFLATPLDSLIVPDEVPTLLSLIYSNIPTLKKGTDSRLGWGFRLGDRADFQVLVELGPQKETQPLANQGDSSSNSNKRSAAQDLASRLYAMQRQKAQQQLKQQQQKDEFKTQQKYGDVPKKQQGSIGSQYLQQWRQQMLDANEDATFALGVGEIDAKTVIADEEVEDDKIRKPLKKIETTTSISDKDALDNVDLD